ncbi:Flp pilus assembly protein CpaB [Arthrobacter halodurans]|uniref:Flp pilus assembly protein CpaB n=1 Tax=Arthrobacter halodurans TaxID=516699 RepID=A0ABV4UJW1_9MICC
MGIRNGRSGRDGPGRVDARGAAGYRETRHRRSWRELQARYRRPLAACFAALSVAAGLAVVAPDHVPTRPVVVAARDLPAGSVLDAGSLAVRELATAAIPPDVHARADDVAGSQLAVPLAAGSPVPSASLVGPGLLTGTAPGTVAVPLHPSDPETVGLLSPGQLVDVVLSEGNGFERPVASSVLARAVPVLWVPAGADATAWPSAERPAGMVVVAATRRQAALLAGAASRGQIFLLLVADRDG